MINEHLRGNRMRIFIAAILSAMLPAIAYSESLTVVHNEYMPLMETRDGEIESCGVHFSAVLQRMDGTPIGAQGSINTALFKGGVPSMMIKVTLVEPLNDEVAHVKLLNLTLRSAKVDTNEFTQVAGDDGYSRLLVTTLASTPQLMIDFNEALPEGLWVSASVIEGERDWSFRLPRMSETDYPYYLDYLSCRVKIYERVQTELEASVAE